MVDFAAEGLLDGLHGEARAARLRLLAALHADGVALDELRAAVASDTLFLLPAERRIGGPARHTRREIAAETDLDVELLDELRRAQGLPTGDHDERDLTDADLEAARMARIFLDAGLEPEDMIEVARILGRGLSQAAEVMRRMTLRLVVEPDADEHELAVSYADVASRLEPLAAPMLGQLLNLHLRHAVRAELLRDVVSSEARDVAVGFADLVGFTRVGERVPPEELGAIAARLEILATQAVTLPTRMVKTIGDAVMLVSPDVDALVESLLALVEAADEEGEQFPQLRAGIACGPALPRAGDWYGRPVNLASRVTGIARPGTVLVTETAMDACEADWRWSRVGERRVRGVREAVTLFRVRPPEA